ncbi:hypothetical protein RHGRI_003059 [Rhododendron griersonianum]|uniref:Uncharacterized protein n=1 Tax=Rhododendron griersonianum TaxID=479676 RepID=A0AAV6LRF4_9ERIC|nr:hypothetical protein RHGRI_003059 [Rhododendron griersonianum]
MLWHLLARTLLKFCGCAAVGLEMNLEQCTIVVRVGRVGESTSRSTRNLQYTADVSFIKKYSVLFELGEQFEWKKAGDFEDWLSSIVNARPRFIQPFYHSANALPVLPTSPRIDQHCCWFVEVVQIRENTTVTIPEEFAPYIFAPPDAVVIIHSGARFFYVKLKNDELTVGWDSVALAHNLGRNYILMFGLVGHLQFDLFVFDEEGCEISYDWSTTLPIHQVNAPIGWDAELAMSNANASNFRASRHALRSNLLLSASDLERLVGNVVTDNYYDNLGTVTYWWSHAMISDRTYHQLISTCDFTQQKESNQCETTYSYAMDHEFGNIDQYNIYAPPCNNSDGSTSSTRHKIPFASSSPSDIQADFGVRSLHRKICRGLQQQTKCAESSPCQHYQNFIYVVDPLVWILTPVDVLVTVTVKNFQCC